MIPAIVFVVAVLAWILSSERLKRFSITAPIVLTLAGVACARLLGAGEGIDSETVRVLIEVTLAVVLFVDASGIAVHWFREEGRYPARLLGIGFPLTFLLGTLTALVVFGGLNPWAAAVIGAALAPTDAALGVSIIENERIPLRFRQVINVESGLNDGLATPLVSFCIVGAAASIDSLTDRPVLEAVWEIVLGVALGFAVGALTGKLAHVAGVRGWAEHALLPIVPLAIAIGTYLLVVEVGGNGFVAAFVGGVAYGWAHDEDRHQARGTAVAAPGTDVLGFTRRTAQLLGFAVWFVFGESVLGHLSVDGVWRVLVYAALSLTVLRMLPVALSSLGLHLSWDTVALAGWLGPRGLASIIFGILAADAIGGADGEFILSVIGATVGLSVVLHGLTAGPLAQWYSGRHPVASDDPSVSDPAPG